MASKDPAATRSDLLADSAAILCLDLDGGLSAGSVSRILPASPFPLRMTDSVVEAIRASVYVVVARSSVQVMEYLSRADDSWKTKAIMIAAKEWSDDDLESALSVAGVHSVVDLESGPEGWTKQILRLRERSALLEERQRLLKGWIDVSRHLRGVTRELSEKVEIASVDIAEAKLIEQERLTRSKSLTSFVRDISDVYDWSDLLARVQREAQSLGVLDSVTIATYCAGDVTRSYRVRNKGREMAFSLPFDVNDSDHDLVHQMANFLGRPMRRPLKIELPTQELHAELLLEASWVESQKEAFVEHWRDWLAPLAIAVDRLWLEHQNAVVESLWAKAFSVRKEVFLVVDSEYRLIHSNQAAHRQALETKDARCFEVFAGRSSPCEACPIQEAPKEITDASSLLEVAGRRMEVRSFSLDLPTSRQFLNQYVDLTEARHKFLSFLQTEKMASIGLLAENISHELNNPLTGLRSLAQLLAEQTKERKSLSSDFSEVEKAAARCQDVIRNLSDFAAGSGKKLEVVNLVEVVNRVVPLVKSALREHRMELELTPHPVLVRLNPSMIIHVVFNLITNACQAMQSPGVVRVCVATSPDGKWARLTVSDDGPGIPKGFEQKIFEPFFTTKAKEQGTGLGLSLSRSIVLEFGGRMQARNLAQGGAELEVELPIESTRH